MRKILFLSLFLLAAIGLRASDRQVVNFNFGWQFHLGDADIASLDKLDDWKTIDVPHDFQIEEPWTAPASGEKADNHDEAANVVSRLSPRGFKEMNVGWYRKVFHPADSLKGKRVLLDFEGIMYVADVYLNGRRIGGTDYGYVGFEIDITKLLRYGQDNTIAVKASTSEVNASRWYTGGGLFRDVRIVVTNPELYLARHPLYVTTTGNRVVKVQAEVANYTRANRVTMLQRVLDAQGREVFAQKKDYNFLRRMRTNEIKLDSFVIDNPHLWSCDDPYLYTAEVTLFDAKGRAVDQAATRFGVRTVEIGPAFGLRLNGKKVLLKGNANHHTLGALGAAAYPRAMRKRLQMLKDFGFNHIRTSHNPYSESFLDLCDEMGILVVDELYDKWLKQYTGGRADWTETWPKDLPEWIKRDRNHPSVVMWSLGNELQTYANLPFGDWGVTPYRMMYPVLKRYDDTRKVTVAMHPRGRNWDTDSLPCDLAMITDVQSYNYRYMYFDGDGRRFPWMTFYQSEANTSNMGPNFFGMNLDKVVGVAYWGQIDYLGESQGWPAKGWAQGSFDISLQPKPIAWLLRSMFKPEEPVVHIGIVDRESNGKEWNNVKVGTDLMSENWNRHEGDRVTLWTYTNADKVELLVNGKSIGVKENSTDPNRRNKMKWNDVPYERGYVEALAYKDGKVVARHRIETTGKATRLTLTPDVETWKADGTDLMHVRVKAVDSKGRRVYAANQQLTFEVEGDARIVGLDNGDITSNELSVGNQRKLFNGSALVILRAGQKPGNVVLRVSAPGFKTQRLKLNTAL